MPFWDNNSDQQQAYDQWNGQGQVDGQDYNDDHQAKFSHELLAGAASWEAARKYEQHCEANGQPPSHDAAKELMAGFAGAFVDREVETRGMDYIDREKAKRRAEQDINQNYDNNYGNGDVPQQW